MNSRILSSMMCLVLSGCVFGENKQYFGSLDSATALVASGAAPLSVAPSATATPVPTATPVVSATATPVPTATPVASCTPTPTATPDASHSTPTAQADGPFETSKNQALAIAISDLLLNDTDPAGLPLHYTTFQSLSSGSMVQTGSNLVFTPANNFTGAVTFQYSIANSLNLTATATVTINVRKAATQAVYGQSSSTLYSYNTTTGNATTIANFRLANGTPVSIFDIAINPSGIMYAVDGHSLYYADASTGILTVLPTTGLASFGNINGLTSLSDGRLVISGDGIAIYNVATRTLSTLVAPGGYQSSGDIIALPDGNLYWSVITNSGNDDLIKVNPNTGATSTVGTLGHGGVYGLGYANGILMGFDVAGLVFQINPSNATTSDIGNTGTSWYGATTNPVLW